MPESTLPEALNLVHQCVESVHCDGPTRDQIRAAFQEVVSAIPADLLTPAPAAAPNREARRAAARKAPAKPG